MAKTDEQMKREVREIREFIDKNSAVETDLDAYLAFRKEIDTMFYSEYKKWHGTNILTYKDCDGNNKAILIVELNYINGLWVAPEYRRQHIGHNIVIDFMKNYYYPTTLHILNNNPRAYKFWNSLFELEELEVSPFEALYAITPKEETLNELSEHSES